jgi:hypothetical protein
MKFSSLLGAIGSMNTSDLEVMLKNNEVLSLEPAILMTNTKQEVTAVSM